METMQKQLMIIIAVLAGWLRTDAEVFLNEDFDYSTVLLISGGKWVRYGTQSDSSIPIVDGSLTYDVYQPKNIGASVALIETVSSEKLQYLIRDNGSESLSGCVYYSALINVAALPSGSKTSAFLCLAGSNSSGKVGGNIVGSEGGGLFAKVQDDGFVFGVSRNVSVAGNAFDKVCWHDVVCRKGITYLVVVKYEIVSGVANDKISLWVNPVYEGDEPEPDVVADDGLLSESLNDVRAIELRQGSTAFAKIPNVRIDALRVTSTFDEVFFPEGHAVETHPRLELSMAEIDFGDADEGVAYRKVVNVKGYDLKDDVRVEGMTSGQLSTTSLVLAKEDVEDDDGCDIELILVADNGDINSDLITFSSLDATPATISVTWNMIAGVEVVNIDEDNIVEKYDLYGRKGISGLDGIYLMKLSNGRVVKVIIGR